MEIIPAAAPGQIYPPAASAIFFRPQNRAHHQRPSKHELIADIPRLRILAEIKGRHTHHGGALKMHRRHFGIDAGHQPAAQAEFSIREYRRIVFPADHFP